MDGKIKSSSNIMVQCRICHDEDEDSNMEIPCSCCGSMKHAHRKCVQRWCNEKGDTTCEICQQQFKPGYTATASPPLFLYGGSPSNFGGNGEISRRDLHNHQFITMVTANHEFLDPDFEYLAPSTGTLICCRLVAIIFTVLLLLRHTLPIVFILSGAGEYSLSMLLALRVFAILLSAYTIVKAMIAIQWHQRQNRRFSPMQSHEGNDLGRSQLRVIHIR